MAIELLTFTGGLALESNGFAFGPELFQSDQFIDAWQKRRTLSPRCYDVTPAGHENEGYTHELVVLSGSKALYRAFPTGFDSSVTVIGCDVSPTEPRIVIPTDANNLFIFGTTALKEHALYFLASYTSKSELQSTPTESCVLPVNFKYRKRQPICVL